VVKLQHPGVLQVRLEDLEFLPQLDGLFLFVDRYEMAGSPVERSDLLAWWLEGASLLFNNLGELFAIRDEACMVVMIKLTVSSKMATQSSLDIIRLFCLFLVGEDEERAESGR